ncbi:hypothetical protein EXS65_01770 [Candidatus Peribacteria bacterium]|nr:hypothetical protein [Candidatus Peribacteria bacterium]
MKKLSLFLLTAALLVSACGKSDTVDPAAVDKAKKYNQVIQKGDDPVDPVHGAQTFFSYGAVSGVAPAKANGIGYLRRFKDGSSVVTVNVNILKAPEKTNYSVMLRNTSTNVTMEVGILESILGDTRHSVELTTQTDVKGYNAVSIYLGKVLVAQGTLKEVK